MEHYVRFAAELIPVKLESTFKEIKTFADIGGGSGYVSFKICQKHPHLKAITTDLPHLEEVFNEYKARPDFKDSSDRVSWLTLDFQKDEYPTDVDAIILG
jgi:O-methyltransferase domain